MYKTVEEITKAFIKDGWSEDTSFAEVSPELANKLGALSIERDIANGHKYYIMNGSNNIFDEKGEVAMYNFGGDIAKCRAELLGFSFTDSPVFIANEGLAYNYLKQSEQLVARATFELSKNISKEAFEEFLNAYANGEEYFDFFVDYNIETNKTELTFETQFAYEDFTGKSIIPTTESEEELLLSTLNAHTKEKTGRPFVCEYNASFDLYYTIEELDKRAYELHKNRERDFSEFTNGELYELYKLCILTHENPDGRSYDDEVFDEIDSRQYEGGSLLEKYKELYTEETGWVWPENEPSYDDDER